MTATNEAEYRRGRGRDHDLERLERLVERLADRVGKLERIMYVMSGLGSATVITAVYNLVSNLQQSAGR